MKYILVKRYCLVVFQAEGATGRQEAVRRSLIAVSGYHKEVDVSRPGFLKV